MEAKRQPNFNYDEINVLLELVERHKKVIECKQSDMSSRVEKDRVWGRIEEEFNLKCGLTFRDRKVLKLKYDNLKKNLKKKVCEEKKYVGGTGGGPSKNPDFTTIDTRVRDLLGDERVEGLPSIFDSDAPVVLTIPADQHEEDDETLFEEPRIEMDSEVDIVESSQSQWQVFGVGELRKPRALELLPKKITERVVQTKEQAGQPSNQPCKTSRLSSAIKERREIQHKTRPYKRPAEKEVWEEVGKAKLELVNIQREIAAEELKRAKIITLQLQEEHALKIEQMKEEHAAKLRLLK